MNGMSVVHAGHEEAQQDRLSFVDAHQHFQDLTRNPYPWLNDRDRPLQLEGDLEPIRRDYLPSHYQCDMAAADVCKTVHVENGWNRSDPVGETRWLEALLKKSGQPTAIVAYADLADPEAEHVIEMHRSASAAVRWIRQILNWHADPALRAAPSPDLMEADTWRQGFSFLRTYDLSFDLQIYWTQMETALALASKFPDTMLIFDHFGMPVDPSIEGVRSWTKAMSHLAQAPNVAVKISGLGLGHPSWTPLDTVPLLRRTIDIFGPGRTMVGTNLPVDSLFARSSTILHALSEAVAALSSTERYAILSGTAERLYRI